MPFSVGSGPAAVLTIAPAALFRERRDLTFTFGHAVSPPRLTGAYDHFPTLDGLVIRSPVQEGGVVRSYSLNHREGWVEAAWQIGRQLQTEEQRGVGGPTLRVWPEELESGVEKTISQAVGVLGAHDVEGSWVAQLTVRGIANSEMVVGDGYPIGPAWRAGATLHIRVPAETRSYTNVPQLLASIRTGEAFVLGERSAKDELPRILSSLTLKASLS